MEVDGNASIEVSDVERAGSCASEDVFDLENLKQSLPTAQLSKNAFDLENLKQSLPTVQRSNFEKLHQLRVIKLQASLLLKKLAPVLCRESQLGHASTSATSTNVVDTSTSSNTERNFGSQHLAQFLTALRAEPLGIRKEGPISLLSEEPESRREFRRQCVILREVIKDKRALTSRGLTVEKSTKEKGKVLMQEMERALKRQLLYQKTLDFRKVLTRDIEELQKSLGNDMKENPVCPRICSVSSVVDTRLKRIFVRAARPVSACATNTDQESVREIAIQTSPVKPSCE